MTREWLEFGHRFADRCGHSKDRDENQRCPVFLQWLDCVHQLTRQFPCSFEFNDTFLVRVSIRLQDLGQLNLAGFSHCNLWKLRPLFQVSIQVTILCGVLFLLMLLKRVWASERNLPTSPFFIQTSGFCCVTLSCFLLLFTFHRSSLLSTHTPACLERSFAIARVNV